MHITDIAMLSSLAFFGLACDGTEPTPNEPESFRLRIGLTLVLDSDDEPSANTGGGLWINNGIEGPVAEGHAYRTISTYVGLL